MNSIFSPNCTRCALSDRPRQLGRAVCVPGIGPEPCDILAYGEAPGGNEERENAPFVGDAGDELNTLLQAAGLRRKHVRIGNVVRCRPPDNRDPTKEEVASCLYYTVREIEAVQPKVIVALGVSAIKALTGETAVGKNRGKMLSLLPDYRSDVPVIPTYHPAAYLHNPGNRQAYTKAIVEDFQLAQRIASGSGIDARIVTPADGDEKVKLALYTMSIVEELACDLEWEVLPTKRKDPHGMWPWSQREGRLPRPVSIALAGRVGDDLFAVSVPLDHECAPIVRKILASTSTYYHNAMADLIWLYSMGWKVRLGGDTMLLASLLNLDTSLSLKALASMLTAMPPGWERDVAVGAFPQTPEDWQRTLDYNAKDAVATVLLMERLRKMVIEEKRKKVLRLYRHVLLPAASILARTALNGTPIDKVMLERMRRRLGSRKEQLIQEVGDGLKLPGDYASFLTVGNEARLAPFVQRAIGTALPKTEKNGRPSITNDVLLQAKAKHPAIASLIRIRKLDKRDGSYYRPWSWLLDQQGDGRLHSVYRLTAARTGRTSAEGELGNTFQQFPRQAGVRRVVRARKGWLIGSVDQSVIEMRIAAWLAQERQMLRFFHEGVDVHKATAGYIKALDQGWTQKRYLAHRDEWIAGVTKEERYGAKAANFGLLFFGSKRVLKDTARKNYGITLTDAQAETGVDAFFTLYPDLPAWHESCWRYVEQGWVETPTGRRRSLVFDGYEDEEGRLRKAINTPVQNFASDLSLFCMAYMWELLEGEYGRHVHQVVENIGFFHDADLLHFDRNEREAVTQIVKQSWEHPPLERLRIDFDVPLQADFKVARRWAS